MIRKNSNGWQRGAAVAHTSRKDVPRVYEDLSDECLADLHKRTTHTVSILTRLDQRSFDTQPEAQRIRAMSIGARDELRQETLAIATRVRDEFRRRVTSSTTLLER